MVCRSRVLLFLSIAALAAAPACNRGGETASGRPRIALVMKTLNNPYFVDMQRGAEEAAKSLNVELIVQAAERETDVERQMQIVENLIQARVGALALTPSGSREVVPAVGKANAANIPVVIVDTRLDPKAAADAGVKHETGDSRVRGFRDAIKGSSVQIVASQPANWERDQGFNVFQNILQAHPDVDTVFACNDIMALGAVEAIAAAGRSGNIRVLGFDAIDDARKAIADGRMTATVAQYPDEMGRAAIEAAVKAMKGESMPHDINVRIGLITKENVSRESDKR
jgi:ribose transport system substrate-binding protein